MKKNKISKNWVNKQRRDIYVRKSKVDGYRARSAYKLIEIDEKFKIFKGGLSVIDIGAAPGSWSQYSSKVIKNGKLISIDLKKMEPIGNSVQIQGDFTEDKIQDKIKSNLNAKVDVVLSDMAENSLFSLSRPLASSTGLRSSLCKFSISAETKASWSFFWSTRHGIVLRPAIFEALSLLSPAITSNSLRPSSLTNMGDNTPWFLIETVSSFSFSLSKLDLG